MNYPIIIEQAQGNYSTYCPDFPGTAGIGDTVEEARKSIIEAVKIQVEEMTKEDQTKLQSTVVIEYFDLDTVGRSD